MRYARHGAKIEENSRILGVRRETDQAFELLNGASDPCVSPGVLFIDVAGEDVMIHWNGSGFRLQGASALGASPGAIEWTTLAARGPVVLPLDGPIKVFRLICPL